MKRHLVLIMASIFLSIGCSTAAETSLTDFFIISRDDNGDFRGSHKIYTREAEGLRQVKYCGSTYWVRPVTVAWTEIEVEQKKEVRVEYNAGKGWRPICNNPEQEVTLKDLGIKDDAHMVVRIEESNQLRRREKAFRSINKAFGGKASRKKTNYHSH